MFVNEYDLYGGHRRFDPDYEMAQSWQRLRSGIGIRPYDVTLLRHEAAEKGFMDQGMTYREAHKKAVAMGYDYENELLKWRNENGNA